MIYIDVWVDLESAIDTPQLHNMPLVAYSLQLMLQ